LQNVRFYRLGAGLCELIRPPAIARPRLQLLQGLAHLVRQAGAELALELGLRALPQRNRLLQPGD
jgi:hypothetical protein